MSAPLSLLCYTEVFSSSHSSQVCVPGALKAKCREGQKRSLSTVQSDSESLLGEVDPWVPLSLTTGAFPQLSAQLPRSPASSFPVAVLPEWRPSLSLMPLTSPACWGRVTSLPYLTPLKTLPDCVLPSYSIHVPCRRKCQALLPS